MAVMIACRGCGLPVPESAGYCFICKCPEPALHASHLVPNELVFAVPAAAKAGTSRTWAWAAVTALGTLFAALAVARLWLAAVG